MKVIITHDEDLDNFGEYERYEIRTPKRGISFGHMEPEDASLCRDLNCVFSIPDMLEEAYNAGKAGEALEFLKGDTDND
jgi:hypothetical protein